MTGLRLQLDLVADCLEDLAEVLRWIADDLVLDGCEDR